MAEALQSSLPLDENRGPMTLGVVSFAFALATVFVALRVYVRFRHHAHGWDDFMIYIAYLFAISGELLTTLEVKNGMGRHIVYILPTLSEFTKVVALAEIGVTIGVGLVKMSVCIMILRLIERTHRRVAKTIYSVMVLNTAITLVAVFCIAFQCRPFEKIWHPGVPGKCFSKQILTDITRLVGAFGCLTDFMCVLVPIFVLHPLQMNKRTKAAIIVIFSLGLFTAACSIGKAVSSEFVSDDFSWENVEVTIWAALEHMLGIAVACMPTLRPLFMSVTESVRNRWRYWTGKRSSDGRDSAMTRRFLNQTKGFENIEHGSGDLIPMRPKSDLSN